MWALSLACQTGRALDLIPPRTDLESLSPGYVFENLLESVSLKFPGLDVWSEKEREDFTRDLTEKAFTIW